RQVQVRPLVPVRPVRDAPVRVPQPVHRVTDPPPQPGDAPAVDVGGVLVHLGVVHPPQVHPGDRPERFLHQLPQVLRSGQDDDRVTALAGLAGMTAAGAGTDVLGTADTGDDAAHAQRRELAFGDLAEERLVRRQSGADQDQDIAHDFRHYRSFTIWAFA